MKRVLRLRQQWLKKMNEPQSSCISLSLLFFLVAREWHRGIVLGQDCSALNNKLLPNDYVFIIFVAL